MADDRSHLETEAAALGVILPEEETRPKVFKVWPENWESVCMFLRLLTQWRMGPRGPVGLDYQAARWLFELFEVSRPVEVMDDLQTMEAAYLGAVYEGAG